MADGFQQPVPPPGFCQQFLVATPAVLTRFDTPRTPADLVSLPFVSNNILKNQLRWTFSHLQQPPVTIETNAVATTDKTPAAYACVLAGVGLSVFPDYMLKDDLASGRLVHVLPDWVLPSGEIHVVFPHARFRPAKVRAFVDLLKAAERQRGG